MSGWYLRIRIPAAVALGLAFVSIAPSVHAESTGPVLNTILPAGGKAGTSINVTVAGAGLDGLSSLHFADSRIICKKGEGQQLTLTIPADVPAGIYDVRAVAKHGLTGPRAFCIGNRSESLESTSNDTLETAEKTSIDGVVNGQLDKPGDIDCYRFTAQAGQRVVLEFWAERLDSKLRGVLELYDTQRKRLAVNRGHAGTMDPLIEFLVPADGEYIVKLFDQTFAGSEAHFYRLDIDTGFRPEFTFPPVVAPGITTRVTLFGRNLLPTSGRRPSELAGTAFGSASTRFGNTMLLDALEVDVTPPSRIVPAPVPLVPSQVVYDAFPYYYPGGNAPVMIGVSDLPIVLSGSLNRTPDKAQPVVVPTEVSGQLTRGDQRDWFAVEAHEGEVLWLEAFGARIGAPVDLDVVVLDAAQNELLRLSDNLENLGHTRFPTQHTDPSGRFVAPADGRYFVMVRNLIGSLDDDPSRVYRLSIRRESPDFHLAVIPYRSDLSTGLNVPGGGRGILEVLAIRHRGMNGPIRISAENLPRGIHCPDAWIGPGTERAPLILSADSNSEPIVGALNLIARAKFGKSEITRTVRGGAMVWPSQPTGWGRLTDEIPIAITPEATLLVTATPWEARVFDYFTPRVFQNSTIDLSVDVERRGGGPATPIRLKGVGLPPGLGYETATIPASSSKGWISFSVPASLPPGPYTIAVQADTEGPLDKGQVAVTTFSNPLTVQVEPERIHSEIDPLAPRKIARGKAIKIPVRIERKNGFIGKILGEVIAPGGVIGLQARGLAFESQLEAADIQVVAADTAPLGKHALLRLELVGMWEDRAVCRGTRFIELEITE
jgi:hypothetical protein